MLTTITNERAGEVIPMRRRELLLLLATGIMGSRAVRGQQQAMPVIGFLGVSTLEKIRGGVLLDFQAWPG
jgi:hypothetical protein